MKKTKVYVASPVRPVLEDDALDDNLAIAKGMALSGCLTVKGMGMLPVSPILTFDGVYDEFIERETIDKACEALLLVCDAIYVVPTPYNAQSKGIAQELEIAKKNGIKILEVRHENF